MPSEPGSQLVNLKTCGGNGCMKGGPSDVTLPKQLPFRSLVSVAYMQVNNLGIVLWKCHKDRDRRLTCCLMRR